MNSFFKKTGNFIIFFFIVNVLWSQEHDIHSVKADGNGEHAEHGHASSHQIGLMLGHTHISHGKNGDNGGNKWEALPSVTVLYNYWINPKWAIGLHTDIIIESFEVEKHLETGEHEELEREYPVAPALMGIYKPGKHFSYMFGAGGEFASTEDLFLLRAETSYGVHIGKGFEFETSLSYDFRFNAYDSWGMGVGITKSL